MGSISYLAGQILSFQVVSLFLALAIISFFVRGLAARAIRTSNRMAFWTLTSLSAIVSVTLLGRHFEGLATRFWLFDFELWRGILVSQQSNFVLNLVLFVPSGIAIALASRRPLLTIVVLTLLSFAIECVQQATGFGAPDPADWVANSLGGILGALVAWPVIKLRKY